MIRRLGLGAAIAAAALTLAACSGGAATQAPSDPGVASAPTAGCEVVTDGTGAPAEIKGFAFPSGPTVKSGDAIAWTNSDGATHTVTFDDRTCSSGSIAAGATVVVRYTVPGTYAFHCAIHAAMKGTLVVTG